jgi:hypothetical protein
MKPGFDPPDRGDATMRFMILIKADKNSEAGVMPDEKLLTEMGKYNEELVKAGVMLAGEGLHPSSKGARVRFSGATRTVIDGPFAETKEALLGLYLLDCETRDAAVEVARELQRVNTTAVYEVRPISLYLPGTPIPVTAA